MTVALLYFATRTEDLVEVQQGELPIVLTAPHGGVKEIPGSPERRHKEFPQFVTVLDTRTDELTRQTAREIEKKFGKKPWVVIAQFSRKYLDVNRPIEYGAESDPARAQYKTYHNAIRNAVNAVRSKFGKGILVDIHGQGADKETVFRGTQNLKTVQGLSDEELFGPVSFLGALELQGIKLFPTTERAHDKENPSFNGGYTVQTYGLNHEDGILAIQLEFGGSYRTVHAIPDTAKKLAKALDAYLRPSAHF